MIKKAVIVFVLVLLTAQTGLGSEYREITSDDVFTTMDLADRSLDVLMKAEGIEKTEHFEIMEKSLGPMHVYQLATACNDMIIRFEKKKGIRPMPKIVAAPAEYIPEDVKMLADMMLAEIRRVSDRLGISNLPQNEEPFYNKNSTDVFEKMLRIFLKLNALTGVEKITPSESFQEMARAVSDVKSILKHIDPAQRYRIDAPLSPPGIKPADVFKQCLLIRQDINARRKSFNVDVVPVPEVAENRELRPSDVFIQIQIIIAELNLLKMATGTVSLTPLPVPVSGKVPTDVHQQAQMVRYLLSQITPLQEMVASPKSEP